MAQNAMERLEIEAYEEAVTLLEQSIELAT